ncbi:calcium/proton exchanger [Polytolypa hystricis UAMH7299]|uniref:Calcium/proton exchanger n=1 Tax=Polytolypa hystricis (strain UAMH7299) TaxID=1447883 RepID=A0A2B7XYK3_POLH7|nr:calcium/proton exchanger [Polytolypa hystricis UAMH7299]
MASRNSDRNPDGPPPHSPALPETSEQLPSAVQADEGRQESQASRRPSRTQEPQPRGSYGTLGPSEPPRFELPLASGSGLQSPSSFEPIRSPAPAPQTPKKPATVRRTSAKPYRGQEFSVDDDVNEYEEDISRHVSSHTSPRITPMGRSTGTLRRRPNAQPSALQVVESLGEDGGDLPPTASSGQLPLDAQPSGQVKSGDGENGEDEDDGDDGDDASSNISDAESFTLKDRQQAINETHPFGIRIWKPALYKKLRSVERTAEGDIHSVPGERVGNLLFLANLLWSLFFGWWLALAALLGALACALCRFSPDAAAYGNIFFGLSGYLLYPFGSFVCLESDENYAEEDEGEGRSISEYEQWQSGDLEHGRLFFGPVSSRSLVGRRRNSIDSASEHDSLLGRTGRGQETDHHMYKAKRRFFGRGEWTIGRVVFYTFFYFLVGPLMLLVSLVCWLLVLWIPMGRVTLILFNHLRRHPLALSFRPDSTYTRMPSRPSSSILLCTYRAAGLKYWKYTVDGTNIFLINLMAMVLFAIFDYWLLHRVLGVRSWVTHPGLMFTLALFSVIPLAYFIGQAVASISAQSSMGMGAAVNAFFSTIVEVYLYCVALTEGKAQLVEGSIVGSIFAGILFLPGLSMCFGAMVRKTQRFNVASAGVTSTMLLFAVIAAFGPTLFYQVYSSQELNCQPCHGSGQESQRDCRRCYFVQRPALNDPFFLQAAQPYSYFAAVLLFLSYMIGLWFTLRTHASVIWASEGDEKKTAHLHLQDSTASLGSKHQVTENGRQAGPGSSFVPRGSIRDSQLYARILGQSLRHVGLSPAGGDGNWEQSTGTAEPPNPTLHVVPPKRRGADTPNLNVPGLSHEQNERLVRQVTEVAATAATFAARDAARARKPSVVAAQAPAGQGHKAAGGLPEDGGDAPIFIEAQTQAQPGGGHDAPNWSRAKSSVVLLGATFLYAIIAEILVNTVDVVLESVDIDEKFLGITLFALVPNTTEFLNAISFAVNGNIALSMEIGSAYALQVCLLQIPALVAFSAFNRQFIDPNDLLSHSFNLIFPQWDMITVILCVFLLSYMYGEGKSNYFKGSILVLTYLFVVIGFYLSGYSTQENMGVDPFDTLALSGRERFLTTAQ